MDQPPHRSVTADSIEKRSGLMLNADLDSGLRDAERLG